jgi:hypothetical protein
MPNAFQLGVFKKDFQQLLNSHHSKRITGWVKMSTPKNRILAGLT